MPLNQTPVDAHQREKLLRHGASCLSDAEILAILALVCACRARQMGVKIHTSILSFPIYDNFSNL